MQKYELMMIFPSDLGEEGVKNEVEELRQQIKDEGEIHNVDLWGKRELSYRIKKQDSGFYVVLNIDFLAEKISEFEKMLNISPAVMRYLLIKTPANYQFKSFQHYQDETEKAEKEDAEKKQDAENAKEKSAKEREAKMKERIKPKAEPVKEIKKEIKEEEEATPKAGRAAEESEEKIAKTEKKPKSNLEDLDKKLKSIIDDPDISL